ncbi:PilZ domain-containing protein [Geobacter sp. DSM 9736]|uniref:PilZ domain-containing protein n=1 Tax=Geobacter sp. DSM 9736 TaxID=1277350 RepID=UPI000B5031D4|nr:PilZ domain-containing protein [Geobacter sp. DSM 9736]SNB46562.1 PilZ domain-containing protein [Geobacter sp. DSM 9736]
MSYSKYFKSGQEILLLSLAGDEPERTDVITSHLVRCGDDFFDLALPYNISDSKEIPLEQGAAFCLLSDALGLGIQLTCHLHEIVGRSTIRVMPHNDMEVFGRRKFLRCDVQVGIYCKRGPGTLRSYRSQWNSAIKSLAAGTAFPPGFSPARINVNISAGGLAIQLSPAATVSELCLVLIDLGDGKPPVIALGEVVWTETSELGKQTAGLRYMEIMKSDQERINNFVIEQLKKQGHDAQWQNYRTELLDKMRF